MRSGSSASTGERALVDTNVLIYAHDPSDAEKHQIARDLLSSLASDGRLVLSTQTLNEYYSVMTRPNRAVRLTHDAAYAVLQDLCMTCTVVPVTPALTFRALEAMPRFALSFWDALIWAAARENSVPVLYTEDLQHRQEIDGVRILNPFLATS